jgi:hypothetical protein
VHVLELMHEYVYFNRQSSRHKPLQHIHIFIDRVYSFVRDIFRVIERHEVAYIPRDTQRDRKRKR